MKYVVYVLCYIFTGCIILSALFIQPHVVNFPYLNVIRLVIVIFSAILLTKYCVYMLLAPMHMFFKKKKHYLHRAHQPLVSVMVPAYNEEVGLLSTIQSLLKSTYKNLEIIIVNDGSSDHSDTMMHEWLSKYERALPYIDNPIHITYCYKKNGGKGKALNTAIDLARGDIVVSIDGDCIVDQNAIQEFVNVFDNPNVMCAVGRVKIGNTQTLVGIIQFLEYIFGFYMKRADSVLGTIYIVGGAAAAFRKRVFYELGGYNPKNITEDIEISTRIQKAGMKIVYAHKALIFTEGASTLKGLVKQRQRWKTGRIQTFWAHRDLFFSTKKKHNKLLTFFVLPLAVFQDIQIGFEPLFLFVLYIFGFMSGDFSAFLSGMLVVSVMVIIQVIESREEHGYMFLLFAPIVWLLFYVLTIVEVYALIASFWTIVRRKETRWQKWARQGIAVK